MTNKIIAVSGCSGVGKTTICNKLLETLPLTRVVTATTRPPRAGEVDGVHYHFLSSKQFQATELVESSWVYGFQYGIPRFSLDKVLEAGGTPLLNIDVSGIVHLQEFGYPMLSIFLLPPSWSELRKRLSGRSLDSEEVIERRLRTVEKEMNLWHNFDLLVVNDSVEDAYDKIKKAVENANA